MSTRKPDSLAFKAMIAVLWGIPLLAILAVLFQTGGLSRTPRGVFPENGMILPDLYAGDSGGRIVLGVGETPLIVSVFASHCAPCLVEHPLLMALSEDHGVPMTGLAWRDDPEKARHWLAKHGNPYEKVGIDPAGTYTEALGITGTPEFLIVSPSGQILYRHVGILSQDILFGMIVPILASM